jgi:hypothetical protein
MRADFNVVGEDTLMTVKLERLPALAIALGAGAFALAAALPASAAEMTTADDLLNATGPTTRIAIRRSTRSTNPTSRT